MILAIVALALASTILGAEAGPLIPRQNLGNAAISAPSFCTYSNADKDFFVAARTADGNGVGCLGEVVNSGKCGWFRDDKCQGVKTQEPTAVPRIIAVVCPSTGGPGWCEDARAAIAQGNGVRYPVPRSSLPPVECTKSDFDNGYLMASSSSVPRSAAGGFLNGCLGGGVDSDGRCSWYKDSGCSQLTNDSTTPIANVIGQYCFEEGQESYSTSPRWCLNVNRAIADGPPPPPGLSIGAIIGIVVGVVALIGIVAGFFLWRRYKKRTVAQLDQEAEAAKRSNTAAAEMKKAPTTAAAEADWSVNPMMPPAPGLGNTSSPVPSMQVDSPPPPYVQNVPVTAAAASVRQPARSRCYLHFKPTDTRCDREARFILTFDSEAMKFCGEHCHWCGRKPATRDGKSLPFCADHAPIAHTGFTLYDDEADGERVDDVPIDANSPIVRI
ncbi:hypothetical protein DFJ74DRAFT_654622 [Hyaloraphidium curvatum]|nr:hypothetical protein DFJ74DRAFT_654622 [Hyaloraphidium curvatum]